MLEALERACRLAHDFHRRGDVSPWRLLRDSGYLQWRAKIDVAALTRFFVDHPELIGEWLVYSDNKRVSSGWYFTGDTADGPYVVGYFPADLNKQEKQFASAADACALFVKCELEEMA